MGRSSPGGQSHSWLFATSAGAVPSASHSAATRHTISVAEGSKLTTRAIVCANVVLCKLQLQSIKGVKCSIQVRADSFCCGYEGRRSGAAKRVQNSDRCMMLHRHPDRLHRTCLCNTRSSLRRRANTQCDGQTAANRRAWDVGFPTPAIAFTCFTAGNHGPPVMPMYESRTLLLSPAPCGFSQAASKRDQGWAGL